MAGFSLLSLGAFVLVNFLAAASGGVFAPGAWYQSLNRPSWTPPNWAFPVVWMALFFMNAVAGWLVWETAPSNRSALMALYGVSLIINAAWSALFFGAKRMDFALIDVTALWLSLVLQVALFTSAAPLAGALGVPYLVWVTIAATLNWQMLRLNPMAGRGK